MAKSRKFTPTGLVGKWKLQGLGSNRRGIAVDESGNNHNGTVDGVPSVFLDGVNDKVSVATPWDSLGGHRYAWFVARANITSGLSTRIIWQDCWNGDNTLAKFTVRMNANKLEVRVRTGASGNTIRTSASSSDITVGSYISLVVCLDLGTDGTVANGLLATVWVNGGSFTMGAFDGDATQGTFAADVSSYQACGVDVANANDWRGDIQWMGYSGMDAGLTATDAQRFFDNPRAWLAASSLDAYWYCKESTGSTLVDNSGNGHTMTITGGTWDVTTNGGDSAINADTEIGIFTAAAGYVDLVTTAKVAQGTARTGHATYCSTTQIVFLDVDYTSDFPVNAVVQNSTDGTWHRITASAMADGGDADGNDDTVIAVTPAATTDFDGLTIEAFKGQLQLLTEDAFAICMWWLPRTGVGFDWYLSNEIGSSTSMNLQKTNAAGEYQLYWNSLGGGADDLSLDHDLPHTDGIRHSFSVVLDNNNGSGQGDGFSWVDKIDPQTDANYDTLLGGNPDIIRLGAKAHDASSGAADTFGPFCLLDLSSAGTVDQTMREGIRDAWHDADMNFETFATDLRALLTGGETIDLTYWKLDEVPYGQEIDTNNVIFRYTRTVSVGSSGTETAEGSATSDTENCTGFPLKTLGDSFKGSGLWMDQVHTIGFGDHADFSFGDGSNDSPMSLVVWADWEVPIANGYVIDKYFDAENEYYVRLELNGKLKLRMEDASVNKAISRYSSSPVDGELHCWVFTYAGDSDETNTHFYLDGDLNDGGASKQAGYIAMEAGTSALRINHLIGSGSIYNAQLYNRELSAGEIQALYAQGAYV